MKNCADKLDQTPCNRSENARKSPAARLFSAVASIKISIFLFALFALGSAAATFLEAKFDTATAWALVYGAPWFAAVQLALGINLFAAIFAYKIYLRAGQFIFHLSFLFMLLGAGITRFAGFEGMLHLRLDESSKIISTHEKFLAISEKSEPSKSAKKAIYLSLLGANHHSLQLENVRAQSKALIPHARAKYLPAEQGEATLVFNASSQSNSAPLVLNPGRFVVLGNTVIAYERAISEGMRVLQVGLSHAQANFVLEAINTRTGEQKSVAAGEKIALSEGMMLAWDGYKLTAAQLLKSAQKIYVPSDEVERPNALLVAVSDGAQTVEKYLFEGESEQLSLGEKEYLLSFGPQLLELDFAVRLDKFVLERYPGSNSPKSYESFITLQTAQGEQKAHIFMNNVLDFRGMRFFQTSYDEDLQGSYLSVNADPGKLPTYVGYFLLGLGLLLNLVDKKSRFRKLSAQLAQLNAKSAAAWALVAVFAAAQQNLHAADIAMHGSEQGAEKPGSHLGRVESAEKPGSHLGRVDTAETTGLPAAAAAMQAQIASLKASLGKVSFAEHAKSLETVGAKMSNERIAPFGVQAAAVLSKISHRTSHKGLSATEVLLRLLSEQEYFLHEPLVLQTNKQIAKLLGNEAKYLSFSQFFRNQTYALKDEVALANRTPAAERSTLQKDLLKLDERINVLYMAHLGYFFTAVIDEAGHFISPFEAEKNSLAATMGLAYFEAVKDAAIDGNFALAQDLLGRIKTAQSEHIDAKKFALEVSFNKLALFSKLIGVYLLLGGALLAVTFADIFRAKRRPHRLLIACNAAAFAALSAGLAMRGYLAGHAPWSNSYESLLYIAWALGLSGLIFARSSAISLALSSILAGVTLFVAHLSNIDPQIGNLAPVLSSIWLSIHVSIITASYGFLGLCALLGLLVLVLFVLINPRNEQRLKRSIKEASKINEMAMILGLSLLVMGNFLGGVWANESWGRYWGWDSKETWALVSILVYAVVLHLRLVRAANSQLVFAAASLFAYYSILMTYFGVNYFLAGMHSYAAGNSAGVPLYAYVLTGALILLATIAAKNHKFSEKL